VLKLLSRYYNTKHLLTLPLYYSINYQQPTIHLIHKALTTISYVYFWGEEGGGRGHHVSMNITPRKEEWPTLKSGVAPIVGDSQISKLGITLHLVLYPWVKLTHKCRTFPKSSFNDSVPKLRPHLIPPYFGNTPTCWLPDYSVYSMSLDIFVVGEVPYECVLLMEGYPKVWTWGCSWTWGERAQVH